jgi:hypothetical protein
LHAVSNFIRLADSTLDLLQDLNPEHVPACAAVTRDYCNALCPLVLAFEGDAKSLDLFHRRRSELYRRLETISIVRCSRKNIFDVVFSALMPNLQCGYDLAEVVERDERIIKWLEMAADVVHIAPSVVAIDVCCGIVGTTTPKWKHCRELTEWERTVRRQSMHPEVQAGYEQLRAVLKTRKEEWKELTFSEQVTLASRLVGQAEPLLHHLSAGHVWVAYRLQANGKLSQIDPCATCRVAHRAMDLYHPEEPVAAIGANWGIDACQCAEASVSSQLHDANQISSCNCGPCSGRRGVRYLGRRGIFVGVGAWTAYAASLVHWRLQPVVDRSVKLLRTHKYSLQICTLA